MLEIQGIGRGERLSPLARHTLIVSGEGMTIEFYDGRHRLYASSRARARVPFTVGGALGTHTARLIDAEGREAARLAFEVDAETTIDDQGGVFGRLLTTLHHTMLGFGEEGHTLWRGRIYRFFVRWLRDHVHTLKGMKYFAGHLESAIDLYHDSQREDGMIWDNVYPRDGKRNMWDERFEYGDFIRPFDDGTGEFKRIPVENDVEYLYIEGLYATWKAVGDDAWMAARLDSAMRALDYTISSPYRWSQKYGLLKRAYTIDTWDFQNQFDARISNDNADAMVIHLGRTNFGVMFGDNTGYAMACRQLAEMLERAGRPDHAGRYRERAEEITRRLNDLAWNGRHFTHHVREDPSVDIDLGVDESKQVSLSNAYSLNRGITHEQAVAILKTYQKIKADLPEGSPGEWYTIYPPFEKGFGGHGSKWQYMNGGVTPIVAGELAHGAFEHGFEAYGADILRRVLKLAEATENHLHCAYVGASPKPPKAKLTPVDLSGLANTDFAGTPRDDRPEGVAAWTGEGDNDLHQMPAGRKTLAGIPWRIADPAKNSRRGCIGLGSQPPYAAQVELPVDRKLGSVYLLHTSARPASGVMGTLRWVYADGSERLEHVMRQRHVSGWWMPEPPRRGRGSRSAGEVAWEGANARCRRVGVVATGFDNPEPGRKVARLVLEASRDGALWLIAGVTLSDRPYYFPPSPVSFGIPDNWGAAAVVYALIEGLAGVVDRETAYRDVEVAPRWAAAGVNRVAATAVYPASRAYVSYTYRHLPGKKQITLHLTGSGDRVACRVLLPKEARKVRSVTVAGAPVEATIEKVERSRYATFAIDAPQEVPEVVVTYA